MWQQQRMAILSMVCTLCTTPALSRPSLSVHSVCVDVCQQKQHSSRLSSCCCRTAYAVPVSQVLAVQIRIEPSTNSSGNPAEYSDSLADSRPACLPVPTSPAKVAVGATVCSECSSKPHHCGEASRSLGASALIRTFIPLVCYFVLWFNCPVWCLVPAFLPGVGHLCRHTAHTPLFGLWLPILGAIYREQAAVEASSLSSIPHCTAATALVSRRHCTGCSQISCSSSVWLYIQIACSVPYRQFCCLQLPISSSILSSSLTHSWPSIVSHSLTAAIALLIFSSSSLTELESRSFVSCLHSISSSSIIITVITITVVSSIASLTKPIQQSQQAQQQHTEHRHTLQACKQHRPVSQPSSSAQLSFYFFISSVRM